MTNIWHTTGTRGKLLCLLLLAAFVAAPLAADRYVLSVLILVFYFAYLGQAWNLLMGFAGQLSLGHALYLGLGAYTATALWTLFGIGPWIGVFIAIPVAAAAGLFVGWLGWRGYVRQRRPAGDPTGSAEGTALARQRFLGFTTLLLACLSALAIAYGALVLAFVRSCR